MKNVDVDVDVDVDVKSFVSNWFSGGEVWGEGYFIKIYKQIFEHFF